MLNPNTWIGCPNMPFDYLTPRGGLILKPDIGVANDITRLGASWGIHWFSRRPVASSPFNKRELGERIRLLQNRFDLVRLRSRQSVSQLEKPTIFNQ